MHLRLALALSSIGVTALLTGCGASPSATPKPNASSTPVGATVISAASHDPGSSLDLQRVVVRISGQSVTATFRSYHDLSVAQFQRPRCAAAGVTWPSRNITLAVPSYYQPNSGRSVKSTEVAVKQVNSRTVQVTAPRTAFGSALKATDPWRAYAAGPACPPMMVELEWLPGSGLVHPT